MYICPMNNEEKKGRIMKKKAQNLQCTNRDPTLTMLTL